MSPQTNATRAVRRAESEAAAPLSGALLGAATAALQAALPLARPADTVLREFFRDRRLGSRERGFVAEAVFGVLRHLALARQLAGGMEPRAVLLAYLARVRGFSVRELAPLLSADESSWLAQIKAARNDDLPFEVQAELPQWLVERLRATHTDADILALGRAMQATAPLDLRVNTLRASRDEVLAALAADGIAAAPTPYSPVGIRLEHKPALERHPLFLQGKVEVQDEGSQLLAFVTQPHRRDLVVDFCAGAGGKTLALGALMRSQGRIYAFDVSEKRLARFAPRLRRSGLSNVHTQRLASENDARIKRLAGKIDRVLVDAPCTGLGTLRRNPDLKWRQSPQTLAELPLRQEAILASAARLPKPGARLVYATCSFLREENEDIVERFLERNPQFVLGDCAAILAAQHIALDTGRYLVLSPQTHGTDGFFAAVLERREAPK